MGNPPGLSTGWTSLSGSSGQPLSPLCGAVHTLVVWAVGLSTAGATSNTPAPQRGANPTPRGLQPLKTRFSAFFTPLGT